MRIREIENRKATERMKRLIDACAFASVIKYFNDPSSDINTVAIVDETADLAQIAALLTAPSSVENRESIETLIFNGKLKIAYPENKSFRFRHKLIECPSFAEIGAGSEVEVIYAPPVYIAKPTGRLWR